MNLGENIVRVLWTTHTHTHTRLTALCPGLPGWAGTRKVKPIWILLKQQTVSGSGIRWAICKSAPRCRQITTTQFFTGRMPFLLPNSVKSLKAALKGLRTCTEIFRDNVRCRYCNHSKRCLADSIILSCIRLKKSQYFLCRLFELLLREWILRLIRRRGVDGQVIRQQSISERSVQTLQPARNSDVRGGWVHWRTRCAAAPVEIWMSPTASMRSSSSQQLAAEQTDTASSSHLGSLRHIPWYIL